MAWFLNHYRHKECHVAWLDEWSCCCNDECPKCGGEIEPYKSDDLSVVVEEVEGGGWKVSVSPDDAEDHPNYTVTLFSDKRSARRFARAELRRIDLELWQTPTHMARRNSYFAFSTTPTIGPIGRQRSWRLMEGA
jgi:hypothetical protein